MKFHFKIHKNKRGTMRIYTQQRIDMMSTQEKQNAIDAVKTSASLTVEEKKINLDLLEKDSIKIAHMQIQESAADISDICS